MPELPEVETVVNDLRQSGIIGSCINFIEVYWPKTVNACAVEEFCTQIKGCQILSIGRRAKYIVVTLSGNLALLIHLKMTGRLLVKPQNSPRLPHEHLIIGMENGLQIHFHDTRKFGRWQLIEDPEKALAHLGPEPLSPSFSKDAFARNLKRSRRQLKPLLLDQTFIAGMGNIYVDEALWEACLHPQTLSSLLTPQQAQALYGAIKHVLQRGISTQGTTLGKGKANFYRPDGRSGSHQETLNVFRRTGLPCPRCKTLITRIIVGQRSTHICTHCQKLGQ
jgi:formamidopyrimidine-DNA glycosylase